MMVKKKYTSMLDTDRKSEKTLKNIKNYDYNNLIFLKKLIFPPIDNKKISQLQIDDESIKMVTFSSSAQDITNVIMNNLYDFPFPGPINCNKKFFKWEKKPLDKKMKKLVITEMTAGVGGNVLNFAKYFKYVNAIEINTTRYHYLCTNIKIYGYDNINCYNDNSLNLLINRNDISQNIIFFDPPWGGKKYKYHDKLRLLFDNRTIENICYCLFKREYNKMIVIKLPNNYDFDYLYQELSQFRISKFVLNKMTIIILKNYPNNK